MQFRILAFFSLATLAGCNPFYQDWDEKSCAYDDKYCDTPVYLDLDDLQRLPVPDYGDNVPLRIPGKLVQSGDLLVVNDRYSGYHFFDISDRQNPLRLGFYPLPGATELTISNGYLYANSFTDLYAVNIADLRDGTYSTSSVKRVTDQFSMPSQPAAWVEGAEFKSGTLNWGHPLIIGYQTPEGESYLYGVQQ
ncbi:hypothetical protein ACQUQU_15905 [Thalassolituus sp. LLYu03]|uniref:hypothetical protein n=1 Tax=Thalassolituus sp. LLYu03 TaxID=3421656 RepID=UPI003D2819B9